MTNKINKSSEYSFVSRIVSGMLIPVILFVNISSFPVALAQWGSSTNEPAQVVSLIAVLVDNSLIENNTAYEGLKNDYTDELRAANLRERILRFAKDVQLSQPYTKSLIIRVKPEDSPASISQALETLYFKGESSTETKSQLNGVITVGNVPLPVVNKNGNRFISLFPYTDFEDKAYVYNYETNEFERNSSVISPKVEVWHGVIKPSKDGEDGNNELAYYFDKNHLYHSGHSDYAEFDRRMLYADNFWEFETADMNAYKRYEQYIKHMDDFAYLRFTKTLLKELSGANKIPKGDGIDNDLDGFIDEDPLDGEDNDNDGEIDEDNGEDPEAVDAEIFDTLPDVQSRNIIFSYALRFNEVVSNHIQKINDNVKGLGRYDEYNSVPSLITAKDLYTQEYLKSVNDLIETKVDEFAQKLQGTVTLLDGALLSGTITFEDDSTASMTAWNFENYAKHSGITYYNGRPVTDITDPSQCTLYQGGGSLQDEIAQLIERNRLYYAQSADSNNSGYAGCHGGNINNPEMCFPDEATNWVADDRGTKIAENVFESAVSYGGCFDFREATRYSQYLGEVSDFLADPDSNPYPGDKHRPAENIKLYQDANIYLTLKDVLDLYGGFDGTDNDEDGSIDEADEYSLSYSINKDDWYAIGREILGNRKNHFIIQNPPYSNVKQIDLYVVQDISGFSSPIPSITYHKEPLLQTIKAQLAKGDTDALPSNNPRYVALQDQNGKFQRINYPDLFKTESAEDFMNSLKELEKRLINMPGYNPSAFKIEGELQKIIIPDPDAEQQPLFSKAEDAIKWRNMGTDMKHAYIVKQYLEEHENGYEYMYLTAEGSADEFNFEINKDPNIVDNDNTWLDPESTMAFEEADEATGEEGSESVFILQWFTYIIEYLKEISKLPDNMKFEKACKPDDEKEQVQEQPIRGSDALKDELPLEFDADQNGVPDSADSTAALIISFKDNQTKIPSDSREQFTINVRATDSLGQTASTDSFSEVRLEIVQISKDKSIKIYGQDTINLVNGEGIFKIIPTGLPGEFSLIAHTINRPAKIVSNTLDLESEGKTVRVLTYVMETQEAPVFTETVLKDYIIKNDEGTVIALINADTGKIQIKDPGYETAVYESTNLKPFKIGVTEIQTGNIAASVVLVPKKEVTPTVHKRDFSFEDNILTLNGVHVKDLNDTDYIQPYLVGENIYIYDSRGLYAKRIAKFTKHGKVYTADEYFLSVKNPDDFYKPYIFYFEDAKGDKLAEFAIGYPQGSINVQKNEGDFKIAYAQTRTNIDTDSDGLSDYEEITIGTDRLNKDSDGDGYTDKEEIDAGYDPLKKDVLLFSDLSPDLAEYAAFIKLYLRGIITKTADNKINPKDYITREDYVQMVLGLNCINCASFSEKTKQEVDAKYMLDPFPDADISNENKYCIAQGKNDGIIIGYLSGLETGFFKPKSYISRAEAVKVVLNGAGIESAEYFDPAKPWYYQYVLKAQELKLFPKQSNENLYPITYSSKDDFKKWIDIQLSLSGAIFERWINEHITRAEFAVLVRNAMENRDCYLSDSDGDGLPDNIEKYQYNTDPNNPDTDAGGKSDLEEIIAGKDPLNPADDLLADTDGDGMQDSWEENYNLDIYNPNDAHLDFDNDGLTNLQEFYTDTDPRNPDTDAGGKDDGDEVLLQSTDPNEKSDDGNGMDLDTGLYAIGNSITPDIVYVQTAQGEVTEAPVYVDTLPADNSSTLFLSAELLDENGEIITADTSTVIEFYIKEGSTDVEILQEKVKVENGVAVTQIKSNTKAGNVIIDARIIGRELPSLQREVFVEPLEPNNLLIKTDSPVIKTGGLSKTKVDIILADQYGNIVNNSFNGITVNLDGPGLIDPAADESSDSEGTQIESYEGLFTFDLYSTAQEGEISINAVLNSEDETIKGTALVVSTENLEIKIIADKTTLIADGEDTVILKAAVVDSTNKLVKGFNQSITFKTSSVNAGQFLQEPVIDMIDGEAQITFKASVVLSPLEINAAVPGLDQASIIIGMIADEPYEIKLEPDDIKFDSSADSSTNIKASLFDKNGNAVLYADDIPIKFSITEATKKYAEIVGNAEVLTSKGTAAVKIKGKDLSGPVHLIAGVEGLKSATITLQAIKKIKAGDIIGDNPNVLYATMLGAPFGDITKQEYAAGSLLFKGKTQAVTALTTAPDTKKPLININYSGNINILDEAQISASFVPSGILPNRVIIEKPDTQETLAEIYYIYPEDLDITLQEQGYIDSLKQGVYINKLTNETVYAFKKSDGGLSITYNGNEALKITKNGSIKVSDNFFNVTLSEERSNFLALKVTRGQDEIADIVYAINIDKNVNITESGFEYQPGYPYQPGFYFKLSTKLPNYKIDESFSGLSTNLPKGAVLINNDLSVPQDQAPGFGYTSLEKIFTQQGIGFNGDNKHVLFFAAGNNVGKSNLPFASEIGINLGDPTIRIKNEALAGSSGFTEDIGNPLYYDSETIKELILADYNNDDLDDILIAYENGKIKLVQNQLSGEQFSYKGNILDITNGIYSANAADFNNDGYDDLLISTKDSCLGNEVCIYIYENQNGNFIRKNLELDVSDKISQVKTADLNNDDFPDIILADFSGNVRIYYNNFGEIETTSQILENLGMSIDAGGDLKEEILIHYTGMPQEIPDDMSDPATFDDNFDFEIFQLQTGSRTQNEFLTMQEQADIIGFGASPSSMATTENVMFIYMDKDPIFGTVESKKQAIDTNGGTLSLNDKIVYTVTLKNTGPTDINDILISDIIADSVDFNKESIRCLNCGEDENLVLIDSGQSIRPYIITGLKIPAGESRIVSYETRIKDITKISIDLNKNYDAPFIKDEYIDINVNPENNTSGKMIFFYSVEKNSQTGKITYARYISEAEKAEPAKQPFDSEKDDNNDGVPDEIGDMYNNLNSDDDDGDGIPNSWDELNGEIDKALAKVEEFLNKFSCKGGGCIPTPINMAFLVPGNINLMGIPAGYDPGLPVFGWGAPSTVPIWPPTPYQTTQGGRIYLSPTLTGKIATAVCLGSYGSGQCFSTTLPFSLLPESACDALNEAFTTAMSKVSNAMSSLNSGMSVMSGGSGMQASADTSLNGRTSSGGITGSSILGGYPVSADGKTNFKAPGFPKTITDWFAKQMDEIVGKLSDLPDLYVLYPDVNAIVNFTPPKADFKNFNDVLTYINKLPLITLESREVSIKIPALTQKEILKLQSELMQWVNSLKRQLVQFKLDFKCGTKDALENICGNYVVKIDKVIQSVENNLKILEEYKKLPYKILEYRNIQTKYIQEIICYLDAILNFAGGYYKRQLARIRGWMEFSNYQKKMLDSWKAISNLMAEYQKSCDGCKTERYTLFETMMNVVLGAIPEPPIIPFPKWPDIYFDFSQIQLGLKIIWPDVKFKAEPLIFPKLPTLQLPSLSTGLNLSLPEAQIQAELPAIPEIPSLPQLPALPELPDLPAIPIPTLPDIPKPPAIPGIDAAIKKVIGVLGKLIKIICLVKKGLLPVKETDLKTQIESMTARPLTPALPIDMMFKFQAPAITYPTVDKIKITAKMDFRIETEQLYNAVKELADEWNNILTDITEVYTQGVSQASQQLQQQTTQVQQTLDEASQTATETIPDKIVLKAENKYIQKDIQVIPESLPAELENSYLAQTRSSLIAYSRTLNSIQLEDINSAFTYPALDNYIGTRLIASNDDTVYKPKTNNQTSGLTENEELARNLIALNTNAISSAVVDAEEASNPTSGQQLEGLYIYNKDEGINEKILAYGGETNLINHIIINDFDDDTDEDIVYSYGGNVYYKENYKKPKSSKFINYLNTDPIIYNLSEFIPLSPSVNKFSVNYDSGKSVNFSWNSLGVYDPAGYEIIYKDSRDNFEKNIFTASNKINIAKKFITFTTIGRLKQDIEITVLGGSFTVNGEASSLYSFGDRIDTTDTADTKIAITFSDSSQIILGPSAAVTLPDFTPGNFNLTLHQGEALFKSNYFTNLFLQDGSSVINQNGLALLELKNNDTLLIRPDTVYFGTNIEQGYGYIERIDGDALIKSKPRTIVTPSTQILQVNQDYLIHTIEDTLFVLNSEEESRRIFTVKANTSIPISQNYASDLELKVSSGKLEIINIKSDETTDIKLEKGMLVSFGDKITMNTGTAAVKYVNGAKTDLAGGDTLLVMELVDKQNPSIEIETDEGNFYSQIFSYDAGGYRSNPSDIKLMAPQLCSDKEPPFADAGLSQKEVIIMQTLRIDASKSFDIAGAITSYYMDLNPQTDSDNDGDPENDKDLINENPMNPEFILGPFNEIKTKKVVLNVVDESLNIGKQIIEIKVIIPDITLDSIGYEAEKITGSIDPLAQYVPVTIIRDRNGIYKKLGSDLTDDSGEFEISGMEYDDTILIKNSEGKTIAEVDTKTGRIIILDNNYYVDVLEAVPPNLPTRLVIKEKITEIILSTILLIPDINTDVTIQNENFEFTLESVIALEGVHIIDKNPADNINISKLPASDPNFTGAAELKEFDNRLAIIDTGGSTYFFSDKLDLRLKAALSADEPIIIEILYEGLAAAEMYISINNNKSAEIFNREILGMPPEGVHEIDSDGDGMSDAYEYKYGFDALNPLDAALDSDGDSLSNLEEYRLKTDPLNKDTDGDGFDDNEEIAFGKDPLAKASVPFVDVAADNPYYDNILNLSQKNILKGYMIDGKLYFKPDDPITRKDFTDIILKMLCIVPREEAYKAPSFFYDVIYDAQNLDYYFAVIKEAVLQGLIAGYAGETDPVTGLNPFKPDNNISTAEAVKIVLEALETIEIISLSGIQPAAEGEWFAPYIALAKDITPKLLKETEVKETYLLTSQETQNPNKSITRSEFVAIADRVLKAFDCYIIDDDNDGMPNVWELTYGLNPFDSSDALLDYDNEGLINLDEYKYGTDPFNPDTDFGGATDREEVDRGTNPVNYPVDDKLVFDLYQDVPDEDFRKNLEEGIYIVEDTCNMCPCKSATDHSADIISGDIIFAVISNEDNSIIFSKSNEITYL
ncbi:S-layer homology domain-containing protein [Candidatus Peregrinibacteria bacterium]|nr:S-layer homology domain-containing protein [Candidatus Peregrinibacteria bacterium]